MKIKVDATDQSITPMDLKGSEQHLPLKNDPGKDGDPDHTATDAEMTDDMAKTVRKSGSDTQIADALRDIADDR